MDYPPFWLIVGIVLALAYTYWPQGEAKTRVRIPTPEPQSSLFDRYQRRHREMAQHKLTTVSRDWRRTHRDGDAA